MRTPPHPWFHWLKDSILLVALALAACGGGGSDTRPTAATVLSQGVVVDDRGMPLAAATVSVVSSSSAPGTDTRTTTDNEGRFQLTVDTRTPAVIRVDKTGYASGFRAAGQAPANPSVAHRVVLLPVTTSISFDASQDAVLRVPGSSARVSLPANALVRDDGQPIVGEVSVALTVVDPSADVGRMPGLMVDARSGEPIESLGALGVTFTDASGAPMNLAAGQSATLRIAATPAQGASLPATFPLYHLNERTGTWVQEGEATLQTDPATGQPFYEGTVTHFSWWNADQVLTRSTVNVALNTAGAACTVPPDLTVQIDGIDYNGRSFVTGGQGFARANAQVRVQLLDALGEQVDSLVLTTGAANASVALPRCLQTPPEVNVSGQVVLVNGSLSNHRVQLSGERLVPVTVPIDANGRYSKRLYADRGTVQARLVSAVRRGNPDTPVTATVARTDVVMPNLTVNDTVGELSGCVQGWDRYRQGRIQVSLFQGNTPLGSPRTLTASNASYVFTDVPLNSNLTLRLTPPDATLAERSVAVVMGSSSLSQSTCQALPQGPQAQLQLSGSGLTRQFDATASTADPEAPLNRVQWAFGDGTSGEGTTTTHVYTSDGSYTARLTVTDTLGQQSSVTVPVLVVTGSSSVSGLRQVASGELHTCYINAAGGAACEGYDGYGQLGSGTLYASVQPTAVVGLTQGVREVAAGRDFSCALTDGGVVYCWGANGSSQLGPNALGAYSATPVRVDGLGEGVQSVQAGGQHACAITRNGGVKCWGSNSHGQLGNGQTSNTPSASPVDVTGLSEGIVALGLGSNNSCAGTASGLYCWGRDPLYAEGYVQSTPYNLPGVSEGVVSIGAGTDHVCAVTRAGAVRCWGLNTFGQLGIGNSTQTSEVVGANSGFASVSAGPQHTCAVTTTGITHCWGLNRQGQLGNGDTTNSLVPAIATEQNGTALGVGARHYATCVLRTDRTLQCWGWLEGYAPGG
jgi:alpha-tubulin suppressor-like RCC1 family protein